MLVEAVALHTMVELLDLVVQAVAATLVLLALLLAELLVLLI
jgi:hypothetical protein